MKIWFAGRILRPIREPRRELTLLLLPSSEAPLVALVGDRRFVSAVTDDKSGFCSCSLSTDLRCGRCSADVRKGACGTGKGGRVGEVDEEAKF